MPVSIQFDSAVTTAKLRAGRRAARQGHHRTEQQAPGAGSTAASSCGARPTTGSPAPRSPSRRRSPACRPAPASGSPTTTTPPSPSAPRWSAPWTSRRHTMTVRRGGQVIKTIPVSTGRPGPLTETRYGTKVIIRKEGKVTMDSTTMGFPKGDPSYYKIDTKLEPAGHLDGGVPPLRPLVRGRRARPTSRTAASTSRRPTPSGCSRNPKVGDVVKFTGSTRPFLPRRASGCGCTTSRGGRRRAPCR